MFEQAVVRRGPKDYAKQMAEAEAYEDFVYMLLQRHCGMTVVNYRSAEWQGRVGENSGGIEIKFNKEYDRSGNLWIEYYRKSTTAQAEYTESSLLKDDNCWLFVTGTYCSVFIFTRKQLARVRQERGLRENKCKTSRGFLLSAADAQKNAELVIDTTSADMLGAIERKRISEQPNTPRSESP